MYLKKYLFLVSTIWFWNLSSSEEIETVYKSTIDLNLLLDTILQKSTTQNYVDTAKTYNFNITGVYRTNQIKEVNGVEVFYNNGQTSDDNVLNVSQLTEEEILKFILKAKKNGWKAVVSHEKYNKEGSVYENEIYLENEQIINNSNITKAKIKFPSGTVGYLKMIPLVDHNIRIEEVEFADNHEIEHIKIFEIEQNKRIESLLEGKDENVEYFYIIKYALKALAYIDDNKERAHLLQKQLNSVIGENHLWNVILNPIHVYAQYDVKVALQMEGDKYYCFGYNKINKKTL